MFSVVLFLIHFEVVLRRIIFSNRHYNKQKQLMNIHNNNFDEHKVIHNLKHFLPAQAPLKDFIHHNTLHAFQNTKFFDAIRNASKIFGYMVALPIDSFRDKYHKGEIGPKILRHVITKNKGEAEADAWLDIVLNKQYDTEIMPRIGSLRSNWKKEFKIDLDLVIQPILFRILCCYLDQGIAIWNFPIWEKGFLASLQELEKNTFNSFFKSKRVRKLLINWDANKPECTLKVLLDMVVGNESLYEQYLFDQQFSHQGWSGMVSTIEDYPQTLLDARSISLHDLILFELMLEIDALDAKFGEQWKPLNSRLKEKPEALFVPVPVTEYTEVMRLWQEAYEWTYYDEVLAGIQAPHTAPLIDAKKSFQAMFCIDDREISLRSYLEQFDTACETFGTPGFFSVEFFFQPEHGKSYTKQCPAPVTPKFLIKEIDSSEVRQSEAHFAKHSHSIFSGWLISQTLGFWSALKLFVNIFRPSMSPATAYSFRHMDKVSKLSIEYDAKVPNENGLQIGFTVDEMADRVAGLLKSIGLTKDFAPLIYIVGHGSSSVNNPHYAAYDCGACSGRPGSVNARVMCHLANHKDVRERLKNIGIVIPETTQFVGALHDTTRDEILFYDENSLKTTNKDLHLMNEKVFEKALDYNAKERSRRFESIDTHWYAKKIHQKILRRSVSLFEPRPELNHATNALCIVGSRDLTKSLFLDRRAFLNSYDYNLDPEGKILFNIVKPLGPVCGGINLEYFFSRVDNQKLGAGTKLPHNVMGLFGVANGIDGDLRPGLPLQMIEVHDPIRLLIIIEHEPDIVLSVIQKAPEIYEWFINEWVHLAVLQPETKKIFVFKEGQFNAYGPMHKVVSKVSMTTEIESHSDNIPVYLLTYLLN